MFPVSSEFQVRGLTPVTWAIIALCGLIALGQLGDTHDEAIFLYGARPALVVFDIFPLNADSPAVAFTLLSSMFLHAGVLHVLLNMLFFHCFSRPVESLMGSWRYALFYLLCGLAATYTHCLANPDDFTPLVGASGAVSGVLAAHTILLPWTKIRIPSSLLGPNSLPAWVFTAQWVGFQVFYHATSADEGVAWLAHMGGIVAGLMLAPLFCRPGVLLFARPVEDAEHAAEYDEGYRLPTLPSAALVVVLFVGLGGWFVSVQDNTDSRVKALSLEWVALARITGLVVPHDVESGLAVYRKAAAANPDVALRLAKRLSEGRNVAKNPAEALEWYRRAAEQNQPEAVIAYAPDLIEGKAVPRDINRAIALLAKLAEENYSSADLQLGMLLETGEGGAKIDFAAAARHYDRACRNEEWRSIKTNGRQLACYRLSLMMFAGRGVAKDTTKAADLLKGAALNGIRPAQIPYALYLLTGDPDNLDIGSTVGPNDAEARRLLENAAKAGNKAAAEILARLNARKP